MVLPNHACPCTQVSVIQFLNEKQVSGVPTLWHSGQLYGYEPYFIIQPYGRGVVLGSLSAEHILQIAKDVATTLADMNRHNVICCQGKGILR